MQSIKHEDEIKFTHSGSRIEADEENGANDYGMDSIVLVEERNRFSAEETPLERRVIDEI